MKGGRETRNVDAITVAKISELLGAGEIMLNCIDFDGPSAELAAQLSRVSNIRIKRLGSRSGSIGTLIGKELHKEIITFELPRSKNESNDELWNTYRSALLTFLEIDQEVIDKYSNSTK